ncbi:MAG: OmpA family protein [bacterium]|nr:OmpA family protein [bacterium]
MIRKLMNPLVVVLLLAPLCVAQDEPAEQEESQIRDLTGQKVTSEVLIDVLTPKKRIGRPRSLTGPKCDFYRQQRSRGIGIQPVADVAAIEILFAFDSAAISPEAAENLDALGQALSSGALASCCFELEGHTDSIDTEEYNLDLSRRRAASVAAYLAEKFRIDRQRLLSVGYGESRPIATNDTDAGRQKNRRVQIANLGYGELER